MHRALQIVEILRLIVSHLDKPSLASLARTSRVMFWPAVSELWNNAYNSTVQSLAHMLLSPLEIAAGPLSIGARLYRVHMYASLVREAYLDMEHIPEEGNDEDVDDDGEPLHTLHNNVQSLALLSRQPFLFPRLRSLKYTANKPFQMEGLIFLLSPEMEELEVESFFLVHEYDWVKESKWAPHVSCVLDILPSRCPHLSELTLKLKCGLHSTHLDSILRLIAGLPKLTSFECDLVALQPALMNALSRHPGLTDLTIGFFAWTDTFDKASLDYGHIDQPCFPNLQALHIHGTEKIASDVLRLLSTGLEELSVTLTQARRFEQKRLVRLAGLIQARSSRLHKLVLGLRHSSSRLDTPVSMDWLDGIMGCRTIECFEFEYFSPIPFDLRDSTVVSMARAWPLLRRLKLDWTRRNKEEEGGLSDDDALTLQTIVALYKHCPNIRFINFTELSMKLVPPAPAVEPRKESVQLLLEDALSITQPALVAAFFSLLWPRFFFGHSYSSQKNDKYTEVKQLLESMRCLRVMEKNRGAAAARMIEDLPARYRRSVLSAD